MAARIGYVFGMDPVAVLRGSEFSTMVRVAAYGVWAEDEEARNKAAQG